KVLTRMDVRNVHLDHWHVHGLDRVMDRDRSMRVSAWIEHDAYGFFRARLLDPVDQLALVVRLPEFEREFVRRRGLPAERFHVFQRGAAVNLRLTAPEQIEIWSVQDVDRFGHASAAASRNSVNFIGRRSLKETLQIPSPQPLR